MNLVNSLKLLSFLTVLKQSSFIFNPTWCEVKQSTCKSKKTNQNHFPSLLLNLLMWHGLTFRTFYVAVERSVDKSCPSPLVYQQSKIHMCLVWRVSHTGSSTVYWSLKQILTYFNSVAETILKKNQSIHGKNTCMNNVTGSKF